MRSLKQSLPWLVPSIVAILLAIPTIISFIKQKSISYSIVSSSQFLTQLDPNKANLSFIHDSTRLFDPYLTIIDIVNDGSAPIDINDYQSPIIITSIHGCPIVYASIISSSPTGITPSIAVRNDSISILPLLLNPNDQFRIAIVSDRRSPAFVVNARLLGVSRIKQFDSTPSYFDFKFILLCLFWLFTLTIVSSMHFNNLNNLTNMDSLAGKLIYTIGSLLLLTFYASSFSHSVHLGILFIILYIVLPLTLILLVSTSKDNNEPPNK